MKLVVLVLILALIFVLYILLCRNSRDGFFNNDNITVSWVAPSVTDPSNLAYQWTVCNGSASTCGAPTPDTAPWLASSTASTSSVVLSSSNCPNCEFGSNFLFAVRSIDTASSLTSGWTVSQISVAQSANGSALITDNTGNSLSVGSSAANYSLTVDYPSTPPSPSGLIAQLQVTVTRGTDVYNLVQNLSPASLPGPSNTYTYNGSANFGSSTSNLWSPSPPGDLQNGDVVKFTSLVASEESVVADEQVNPVYFFGTQTENISAVAPGAPTSISFAISS